jgi:hypothetical protein
MQLTQRTAHLSGAADRLSQSKQFPLGMKERVPCPSSARHGGGMVARYLRGIVPAGLCLLSLQSHAQTAALKASEAIRLESVTIGERSTEVVIRFDRPISHGRSWISLVHDGKIVATIYPRLEAEPNVLFARIHTPGPGDYIVRWTVCPEGHSDRYDGEFPFTVGRPPEGAVRGPR